jgi:hypothetical protein
MNVFFSFIKENYISIAVIVSIVFVLLIIISIKGWDLNPPKPESKLVQEVVVETFSPGSVETFTPGDPNSNPNSDIMKEIQSLKLSPSDSFCQSHLGKSAKLEMACNELTEEGCMQTQCCVLTSSSGKKSVCKAGDKNGPTFRKDKDGNLISMDAYYYQGIKHDTRQSVEPM